MISSFQRKRDRANEHLSLNFLLVTNISIATNTVTSLQKKEPASLQTLDFTGADNRIRTYDPLITKFLQYILSKPNPLTYWLYRYYLDQEKYIPRDIKGQFFCLLFNLGLHKSVYLSRMCIF